MTGIVTMAGWQPDAYEVAASVRAIQAHERDALRLALGTALAAAIARTAPQHLGLLPPEWLRDAA